jgi:hypothetical protein
LSKFNITTPEFWHFFGEKTNQGPFLPSFVKIFPVVLEEILKVGGIQTYNKCQRWQYSSHNPLGQVS